MNELIVIVYAIINMLVTVTDFEGSGNSEQHNMVEVSQNGD